jgi:hypothetical protein
MGEGCLADQVLGQYFACIAGLGNLVNSDKARKALESIHRYNFKRDLTDHESVQRTYALNDDAGLLLCDYAGRERPQNPFPYYAEVWTGIEYQVASHMFFEGLLEEGLEIFEAVRLRHDGSRRNPWDEPECGHHYGRALAAWSGVLSLCGFDYSAPEERVSIAPRLEGSSFRGFWSLPSGWGSFARTRTADGVDLEIEAKRGELRCGQIALAQPGATFQNVSARAGSAGVDASLESNQAEALVRLRSTVAVTPEEPLRLRLA